MSSINIAVVGLGFMGATHLKAYQKIEGAHIHAICDAVRLPEDGVIGGVAGNVGTDEAVRLDMSVVQGYREYAELLQNPDVQLIDLCVPTSAHVPMSIAALQAGKHVICEKPLARTSAKAQLIVEAAAAAQGYFMPAMCMRFWPEWAWLKQAITDQRFGKVLAARFRRVSAPPTWGKESYYNGKQSGGALLDLHIHDTDFVQFCFGLPQAVLSSGISHFTGAVDHVITQYKVACGATVMAEGSWLMSPGFGFNMSYTVNFENGTVDYDLSRGEKPLLVAEADQPPYPVTCEGIDGYVGELTHMLDAIRNQTPPSTVTATDGLTAVRICEAEEASIQSGDRVPIPS